MIVNVFRSGATTAKLRLFGENYSVHSDSTFLCKMTQLEGTAYERKSSIRDTALEMLQSRRTVMEDAKWVEL